jgi:hypothetical protein
VEAGADVSKSTFLLKSPLYIACEMGHTSIVSVLLKYSTRGQVLSETNYGTTAAFIAQRNGFMKIMKLLTDFMTSTHKESAPQSFTRVQKERQKAYMAKLQTKYSKLELKQEEAKKRARDGKGSPDELTKELGDVAQKLKTAKDQLEKAHEMGNRSRASKKGQDGEKVRRKKSKKTTTDMQRKRRGSAYGPTSTSRRRSSSRPHSRPIVPDDPTREQEDEEMEKREQEIKVRRRGDKEGGRERRRSKSKSRALQRPVRRGRGWHGEGGDVSEEGDYSGGEDMDHLENETTTATTKKGWDVPSDMSQEIEDTREEVENDKPQAPTSPVMEDALPPPKPKINDRYTKNKTTAAVGMAEEDDDEQDGAYTDDDFEEATPKVHREDTDFKSNESNEEEDEQQEEIPSTKQTKDGKKKRSKFKQNMFEKKRTSHVTTATTKAFENKTPKEKKSKRGARPQMGMDKSKRPPKMKLSDMSMQKSQQVYGKMYGKSYQAPPSNSQSRAQSGRPTVPKIAASGEDVQLPPPESPSRTQAKSPRGGWHRSHQQEATTNKTTKTKTTKQPLLDPAVAALLKQGSEETKHNSSSSSSKTSKNGVPDAMSTTHAVFQCLQGRSLSSIHRCLLRFSRSTSGFLISPSLLAYVFGASTDDVDAVFEKFNTDLSSAGTKRTAEKDLETDSVDAFECFVATTMLASASLEDRLRFCFGLFDREGTNRLSRRHVGMLIRCCITSVAKLHYDNVKAGSLSDLTTGGSISTMVEEVFAIRSSNPQKSKGGSETVSAKQYAKWARGYKGGLPCPFVVILLDLQNNVQNHMEGE